MVEVEPEAETEGVRMETGVVELLVLLCSVVVEMVVEVVLVVVVCVVGV